MTDLLQKLQLEGRRPYEVGTERTRKDGVYVKTATGWARKSSKKEQASTTSGPAAADDRDGCPGCAEPFEKDRHTGRMRCVNSACDMSPYYEPGDEDGYV